MFMKGQLIGANTEFNGYGATKTDFLKQVINLQPESSTLS